LPCQRIGDVENAVLENDGTKFNKLQSEEMTEMGEKPSLFQSYLLRRFPVVQFHWPNESSSDCAAHTPNYC